MENNLIPELPPNSPQLPSEFVFRDTAPPEACTLLTCPNGHKWVPTLESTYCPGCRASILVLKMVNCPQCNEPSGTLRVRMDHLPKGGSITPLCRGSATMAETIGIEVKLNHAAQEAANHVHREVPSKI